MRNKTIAREFNDVLTAVYDFQKVHGLPYGETSILYYKRKLTVFNFTVYEMGSRVAKCYVWDESTAKRGANEVSSCLYNYIKEHHQKGIKIFNFWSDNCGGQNRNRIVFAAYLRAAKAFQVTHKYFEKGHTQNEGDSVHKAPLISLRRYTSTLLSFTQCTCVGNFILLCIKIFVHHVHIDIFILVSVYVFL
ncbi:unnamed protein product [Spodoptera littoralis]|uniref:Uncharacterized protein n=1 Tax=Spodoptera littoralis TaxID=7109 RepID=A0A9P0N7U2_SPOLI|nr:unnamed protein product [Spodoptera littoralis]CAH1645619.1 unnamed protein product [Spodoptera littoralis]